MLTTRDRRRMRRAFRRAIKIAGGQSALGRRLRKRQSTVGSWLKRGYPAGEYAIPIEALTGVSRHELRPDLYPREPAAAAAERAA